MLMRRLYILFKNIDIYKLTSSKQQVFMGNKRPDILWKHTLRSSFDPVRNTLLLMSSQKKKNIIVVFYEVHYPMEQEALQ